MYRNCKTSPSVVLVSHFDPRMCFLFVVLVLKYVFLVNILPKITKKRDTYERFCNFHTFRNIMTLPNTFEDQNVCLPLFFVVIYDTH